MAKLLFFLDLSNRKTEILLIKSTTSNSLGDWQPCGAFLPCLNETGKPRKEHQPIVVVHVNRFFGTNLLFLPYNLLSIHYIDAPWQAAAGINLAAVDGIDAFRSAVAVILRE